nr:2Fe-2S iron-sulfur cluster-binding protein [Desulfobacterales bacterium]
MAHRPFDPKHPAPPGGGRSTAILTLRIDGQDVGARSGDTILAVARENEIHIPTLCHLEGLSSLGACRLCLVEVTGAARLMPACVTAVRQ